MSTDRNSSSGNQEFLQEAQAGRVGLVAEFIDFLKHNKKWWLAPIILVLILLAVILAVGGTAAAPFIYPLF